MNATPFLFAAALLLQARQSSTKPQGPAGFAGSGTITNNTGEKLPEVEIVAFSNVVGSGEAVGRQSCISANSDSVWFYENQFASKVGSFLTSKEIEETRHDVWDESWAILDL